jgi:hypothetical protein
MNHKQVVPSVVVQCPAITKPLCGAVLSFMNRNHCPCGDCAALKRIMADPPNAAMQLSFSQATMVMHGLRTGAANCDYALGFAEHLCQLLGTAIGLSQEHGAILHQLEQSHAYTREQIRYDRLRLWFACAFSAMGIPANERGTKLMNEARRLLTEKNEFPVNDPQHFRFDPALRNRVDTLADWLAKQIV